MTVHVADYGVVVVVIVVLVSVHVSVGRMRAVLPRLVDHLLRSGRHLVDHLRRSVVGHHVGVARFEWKPANQRRVVHEQLSSPLFGFGVILLQYLEQILRTVHFEEEYCFSALAVVPSFNHEPRFRITVFLNATDRPFGYYFSISASNRHLIFFYFNGQHLDGFSLLIEGLSLKNGGVIVGNVIT